MVGWALSGDLLFFAPRGMLTGAAVTGDLAQIRSALGGMLEKLRVPQAIAVGIDEAD